MLVPNDIPVCRAFGDVLEFRKLVSPPLRGPTHDEQIDRELERVGGELLKVLVGYVGPLPATMLRAMALAVASLSKGRPLILGTLCWKASGCNLREIACEAEK